MRVGPGEPDQLHVLGFEAVLQIGRGTFLRIGPEAVSADEGKRLGHGAPRRFGNGREPARGRQFVQSGRQRVATTRW